VQAISNLVDTIVYANMDRREIVTEISKGKIHKKSKNSAIHGVSAQASNLWMSFALKCWSSIMYMILARFPPFAYSARKEIHEMQLRQPSEKGPHVPRTVGQQSITW